MYHKFAEIIEPAKEGYTLTLRLNFSGLTRPKGMSILSPHTLFQLLYLVIEILAKATAGLQQTRIRCKNDCSLCRSHQGDQPDIVAAIRHP